MAGQWFTLGTRVSSSPPRFRQKKKTKKKQNKNDRHDITEMLLNVKTPITPTEFIYILVKVNCSTKIKYIMYRDQD